MAERLFALSLGFGALILLAQAAGAAPRCAPRAVVLEQLADRYGENRRSVGIAANNMVMELFVNSDSQSWTITITTPQGQTCLLASGSGFEALTDPLPAKGSPV
ncbi:hypothetical protein [Szabonella alba]|uniref:Uncharacterized protein n=1 Tax=Szabonella alba TaxID=2804194 RepID=A0A8K0XZC3_9RHOB|nr:hypothetical protein [Szabonella alba]MBL4915647.1 hypothetical protein [Szabonella alba]